jgi:hydrogenase/urease accessory protein HupE
VVCRAHESRPAYLELTEHAAGQYHVVWRRPALGEQVLALTPQFPLACRDMTPRAVYASAEAIVERWTLACGDGGLVGRTIAIRGLSNTITDVLVRVSLAIGVTETKILRAGASSFTVRGAPAMREVASSYCLLGVQHIWSGIDHLLFVLGLLLLVPERWLLLKTITAFTVAHSLTLGLAVFGFVHVPQAPVEAVIALSILFLAVELAKPRERQASVTVQRPWIVAFSFGFLHGFGFAGALVEVGLPPTDMPLALVMFNLGVEVGQLLFIALMLLVAYGVRRWRSAYAPGWRQAVVYGIGSLSAFWVIERVAAFF